MFVTNKAITGEMIVPTMFFNEVLIEVELDYPSVASKSKHLHRLYFLELRRKGKLRQQVTYMDEHVTSRRNKWLIITRFEKDGNINSHLVLTYYDNDGLKCISYSSVGDQRMHFVYDGHFFNRYIERQNLSMVKPEDMVKYFFKNDWTPDSKEFAMLAEGKIKQVYTVLKKGLAIGWRIEPQTVVHVKTFVNDELLSPRQMAVVTHLRNHEPHDEPLTLPQKAYEHSYNHLLELCRMYNFTPPSLAKGDDTDNE